MPEKPKPIETVIPIESIAGICHDANAAYCRAIGDNSQPAWRDAPKWQIESAIDGVKNGLKQFERDGQIDSQVSHASWIEQKILDGWKYGAIKDPEKKTHPCLLPYEALPPEQRVKDDLFTMIICSMIA